jgi:hypothetical protein
MVTTIEARTAHYRLKDGDLVRGERTVTELPVVMPNRIKKKYDIDSFVAELEAAQGSIFDFMEPLINQAKRVLQKDKYHIFIAFLFKGEHIVDLHSALFEDRATKHAYSRELAAEVATRGIDGIITLGEIWQSGVVLDEDGVIVPPEEVPDKREALEVYAERDDGEYRSIVLFFHRRFGKIQFDDEVRSQNKSYENNFMAPVRAVWKAARAQADVQSARD